MPLNKTKGNMYKFINYTFNIIKGRCKHKCQYCFMIPLWDRMHSEKQKFDEKELKTDLGKGNFIFVGSSTDMWADEVPSEWIKKVLDYCKKFDNKYLFQSKNPHRFYEFIDYFPARVTLGTTIETNREYNISQAPPIDVRSHWMKIMGHKFEIMCTIEPILDFDFNKFVNILRFINPKWINIGADSKGHNLPEPSSEKIQFIIKELSEFTQVNEKDNLKRLL